MSACVTVVTGSRQTGIRLSGNTVVLFRGHTVIQIISPVTDGFQQAAERRIVWLWVCNDNQTSTETTASMKHQPVGCWLVSLSCEAEGCCTILYFSRKGSYQGITHFHKVKNKQMLVPWQLFAYLYSLFSMFAVVVLHTRTPTRRLVSEPLWHSEDVSLYWNIHFSF